MRLALLLGAAFCLAAMVAGVALGLSSRQLDGMPHLATQRVPAAQRLARPVRPAEDDRLAGRMRLARPPTGARAALDATGALGAELRSNRRALKTIQGLIRSSDADAEQLKSLVQRQEDTIATQQRALAGGAASEAERSQAEAAVVAATETNDLARASLARYEAVRTSLVQRQTSLHQRNAEIAERLNRWPGPRLR